MKEPTISKDKIDVLYDNKYLSLYGMNCSNGSYYLEASRRRKDDLVVLHKDEEYDKMLPDAVTCVLVLRVNGSEPLLYMEREFRYPTAHFLLSPPAGLIDKGDGANGEDARIVAAKREIKEETGIEVKDSDKIKVVSPLFFSSPGMTDESNAIVAAEVELSDLSSLSTSGAEGTECFGDYALLSKSQVKELIKTCRDTEGHFFSVFTWAIMLYFVYEM